MIAYRNGAPVKLSDVAQAKEAPENTKLAAWVNTDPAIIINIQRQPGANVIAVVDSIQALLPELKAALPAGGRRPGRDRPHHHDPRLGRRCRVRTRPRRACWW